MTRVRTSLDAARSSPREARRFVSRALRDWGYGSMADTVLLLTSEVVTNAVMHGAAPIDLTVVDGKGSVRVEVRDRGPGSPRLRAPGPEEPRGRGIALVDAMAQAWGVEPEAGAKLVWFEVAGDRK